MKVNDSEKNHYNLKKKIRKNLNKLQLYQINMVFKYKIIN